MHRLYFQSEQKLSKQVGQFKRFNYNLINVEKGLVGIIGSPSSGRSDLLLQLIKGDVHKQLKVLYVDLADPLFSVKSISGIVKEFYQKGGKALYLDDFLNYRGR